MSLKFGHFRGSTLTYYMCVFILHNNSMPGNSAYLFVFHHGRYINSHMPELLTHHSAGLRHGHSYVIPQRDVIEGELVISQPAGVGVAYDLVGLVCGGSNLASSRHSKHKAPTKVWGSGNWSWGMVSITAGTVVGYECDDDMCRACHTQHRR